ncbi:hypothetical protein E2C01_074692 [Portunus trituberculatus]|uniref:Uncharacterized protein n=1 Tax=Portunus trituberculatus TaxID=210409 RepID=A0A5B7IHW4_PORTR|nr:hypothetical protein [Portunus trituberculatus]
MKDIEKLGGGSGNSRPTSSTLITGISSAQPATPQAPHSPVASTSAVPPVAPDVVLSLKQFWKKFQIKQAPHLKLQEEKRQKQETLLQQTTNSIQQVPGMPAVDNEAVADIVRERTRELTLQEMMEEDEQELIRQRMISQALADILGDEDAEILDDPPPCDTAAEESQAPPPAHISPVSQEDAEFLGFEEVDTATAREVAAQGEDLEMDPSGGGGH